MNFSKAPPLKKKSIVPTHEQINKASKLIGLKREFVIIDTDEEYGLVMVDSGLEVKKGTEGSIWVNGIWYLRDEPENNEQRGNVWAVSNGVAFMVCNNKGYLTEVRAKGLLLKDDGLSFIGGDEKVELEGKPEDFSFTTASEGFFIRSFLYKGKLWFCTHKRIDCSNSTWSGSQIYSEIIEALGIPSKEELYGEESEFSPWNYCFFMTVAQSITDSRQEVTEEGGYATYIGATKCGISSKGFFSDPKYKKILSSPTWDGDKGTVKKILNLEATESTDEEMCYKVDKGLLMGKPIPLTIEEANSMLTSGYYPGVSKGKDPRSYTGEAVIVMLKGPKGIKLIKVKPPSLIWRSSVRYGNANIYNQAMNVYFDRTDEMTDFNQKYIKFDPKKYDDFIGIIESGGVILSAEGLEYTGKHYATVLADEIKKILSMNYIFSLPPVYQSKGVLAIKKIDDGLKNVANFLMKFVAGEIYLIDEIRTKMVDDSSVPKARKEGRILKKDSSGRIYDITDETEEFGGKTIVIVPKVDRALYEIKSLIGEIGEEQEGLEERFYKFIYGTNADIIYRFIKYSDAL